MNNDRTDAIDPQLWIAERWDKHNDSISVVQRFSKRSSWYRLSLSEDGLDAASMSSLAAAFANEGNAAWLDSSRLAWRMAVAQGDLRTLAKISGMFSQLGQDPYTTPELHHFRERSYFLSRAFCTISNWNVGQHLVDADWAKVLRNSGDCNGFKKIAADLDNPRVLRSILGGEASAVQRFRVVQVLALYELEKSVSNSRLDWMLGLLSELGSDCEAGSTAMRVLLVDTEQAIKQRDFYCSFVGALQLVQHMTNENTELCSRADLACTLRSLVATFSEEKFRHVAVLAVDDLARKIPSNVNQIESLARDIDRLNSDLSLGLSATLPRMARRENKGAKQHHGEVLTFNPKDRPF